MDEPVEMFLGVKRALTRITSILRATARDLAPGVLPTPKCFTIPRIF